MKVKHTLGIGWIYVLAGVFVLVAPDSWLEPSLLVGNPSLRIATVAFCFAIAAHMRDVTVTND